jgi:integrase/recombinase XerD
VPIGERALHWIDRYLREVRPRFLMPPDLGTVFLTKEGEALRPKHLTRIMGEYVARSGIGKPGSCHIFRHAMATAMLENGAGLRYLQELLGHATPATTQIDTRVSIQKLREVHARTHPASAPQDGPPLIEAELEL